jgi:hypothetical protein
MGMRKDEDTGAATAGTAHTHPIAINRASYRLDITSAGVVATNDPNSANNYLSFDGISFIAEQ